MNLPFAAARAEGRAVLLETEGLRIAEELGLAVPRHVVVQDPGSLHATGLPPGERVVVKALAPDVLHKTELGAVAVVPAEIGAVQARIRAMQDRLHGKDLRGFLVAEFVPHSERLGDELLLGIRWTDEFGPVVTLGAGGTDAEFVARNARPGSATLIVSPEFVEAEDLRAALAGCAVTRLSTEPQRGQPPRLAAESLVTLLQRCAAFARAHCPTDFTELEFNPVARASDDGRLVALDALCRLDGAVQEIAPPRPTDKIQHLLHPRSIAVLGASQQRNPGRIILDNVLEAGFDPAAVQVVKPGLDQLAGCRCVADLAHLDPPVDLLVVAVDAAQVPGVVEDVLDRRCAETVLLIPGGLGETAGTADRVARMRASLHAARTTDWRGPLLNGGNCLGVRSLPGRFDTLFIPDHKLGAREGRETPVALLAQSGAFAIARQSSIATLRPRYVVTVGNQLDLTLGDYLDHLVDADPDLQVFACYVEGFRPGDGARFLRAARRARAAGKAVVLYRAGRSPAGASAAASHTASVAGDYAVTRALCQTAGVLLAETLGEFDDLVRLAAGLHDRNVTGLRVGAVSNAGFECVALADHLAPLALAPFTAATRTRLQAILESHRLAGFVDVHDPLDLTPIAGDAVYAEALAAVLDDEDVDLALVGIVPMTPALQTLEAGVGEHAEDLGHDDAVAARLARLARSSSKPVVAVVDAGRRYDALAAYLEREGLVTFRRADRAARMLGRYVAWRLGAR